VTRDIPTIRFVACLGTARSLSVFSSFKHNANVDFRYTEDDSAPKPTAATAVKSEPAAASEVKVEDSAEQNGDGDEQMYGGEQDDDDEIDFNLGNNGGGAEQSYDAPSHQEAHGPGIKEDG
jgi:RNA-binding protein Musashi